VYCIFTSGGGASTRRRHSAAGCVLRRSLTACGAASTCLCGGLRDQNLVGPHSRLHFREQPSSGVGAVHKTEFKIDDTESGVVVSAQDHKGPVQLGLVMNDRAEGDARVVDEPLHSLAGEVSPLRLRGGEPIEFLSEQSTYGQRRAPTSTRG
jgi:hypothetical protein